MLFKSSLSLLIFCLLVNTLLKGFSGRCGPSLRSSALCRVVGHDRGRVWHFSGFPCSYSSEGGSGSIALLSVVEGLWSWSPWLPVLLFQLQAPSEPQPRPQEAGLPQAEVPQARGNVPSNSEPQTPVPSSEAALDLKKQGEKGK